MAALGFDYRWWKPKNCWQCIDAHFHDRARSVSLSVLPLKEANTLIMYNNDQVTFQLPDLQDQKLLTLCRRSFSEWGREGVTLSFAHTGNLYLIYDYLQPIATQITQDATPKIVDTPLTLILPRAYLQFAIIWFGILYHSQCLSSLSILFMYFLLDHYILF